MTYLPAVFGHVGKCRERSLRGARSRTTRVRNSHERTRRHQRRHRARVRARVARLPPARAARAATAPSSIAPDNVALARARLVRCRAEGEEKDTMSSLDAILGGSQDKDAPVRAHAAAASMRFPPLSLSVSARIHPR